MKRTAPGAEPALVVPVGETVRGGWLPGRPAELLARAAARYAALPARRRDVAQDAALALALAVLNLLSLLPYQAQLHPTWLALLLVGGQCLPLALRRVAPVPSLIGCGILRNLYDAFQFGYAPLPLAPAIAFATVADRSGPLLRWCTGRRHHGRRRLVPGAARAQPAVRRDRAGVHLRRGVGGGHAEPLPPGRAARRRRARARAEASLDIAAARAAAAERIRIARELHDVVAHHVSLMAVQAEAVGALLPARPQDAAASADLIGSTARAAMTELRRLLGVLRFSGTEDPERVRLTPVPSLSRLGELTDAVREAGLAVTCHDLRPGGGAAAGRRPDGVPDRTGGADQRPAPRPGRGRLRPRGRASRRRSPSRSATPPGRRRPCRD